MISMETKTINKSIEIKAGRERVWQVLTQQPFLNEVLSIFMEGSTVKGEFKDGADVTYLDPSGAGVVGKVSEFKPNTLLKVSILAELVNGKPAPEYPDSKKWEGCFDQYSLSEKDGVTILECNSVCPAEHYNDFLPGWDKMLGKIKELAEK
jgi:uncharacterized protein YndB with AHSA1/START domain